MRQRGDPGESSWDQVGSGAASDGGRGRVRTGTGPLGGAGLRSTG